jgi:hypothetical protein
MAPMAGILTPSGVATTRTTPQTALPPAEPSFKAPWGELERELPYVTITTQPWPEEWWRPAARQVARVSTAAVATAATAIARATDTPSERLSASAVAVPIDSAPQIAISPTPTPPAVGQTSTTETSTNRETRRATRAEAPKRGILARLALVAAGLVLSLIAVESASRRRH